MWVGRTAATKVEADGPRSAPSQLSAFTPVGLRCTKPSGTPLGQQNVAGSSPLPLSHETPAEDKLGYKNLAERKGFDYRYYPQVIVKSMLLSRRTPCIHHFFVASIALYQPLKKI
jgi:hypothetical protein